MKHTTPVEVWIPRLVNGDLFVHGSPLAGCDTSPEKKMAQARKYIACLYPWTDARIDNKFHFSILWARPESKNCLLCFLNH
jgi:hypothetical protein